MTASRVRTACAVLFLMVPAVAAQAQQTGPIRLLPSQPPAAEQAPQPDVPAPAAPAQEEEQGIMVQDLGQVDADSVGILDASAGGLGFEMWAGTPRPLVERLLQDLPTGMRSPGMRDLARRVLLSTAVIPRRPETDEKAVSLIGMRVQHLMNMGLIDDAMALIAIAPSRETDPALLEAQVNAQLMAFDLAGACTSAASQSARVDEPFWQKVQIFCRAVEGNVGAAQLGVAVLAETDPTPDPAFYNLIDRLTGEPAAAVSSLPEPQPLQLAMMRTARLELPGDVLTSRTPALLRTVGVSPNAPLTLRLEAAEEAAAVGAIPPDLLAEIYASVPFLPRELESPLSAAAEEPGPRSRALLYRAAALQEEPEAQAAILERALAAARAEMVYPLVVRVHGQQLAALEPMETLSWFAAEAARSLYALGDPARAEAWIALLDSEAATDESAQAAKDSLWALGQLFRTPGEDIRDEASEAAWRAALISADPERGAYRVSLAYVVLEALGHEVPQDTWRMLARPESFLDTRVPDVSVRRALAAAATNGGRGETALLALLALGAAGPATVDPAVLADVLRHLDQVALTDDARALAMETVIDAGL